MGTLPHGRFLLPIRSESIYQSPSPPLWATKTKAARTLQHPYPNAPVLPFGDDKIEHGWYQCRHTPGLWHHSSKPIKFALVVDNLAIQYTERRHIDKLIHTLRQSYEGVSIDWDAKLYCGITMKWDYLLRTCELSMPGYIAATLKKFKHGAPSRPQHSPHRFNAPRLSSRQSPFQKQ
jgi:hypothetical protein